jgi:hypothetical protein
MRQPCIPRPSAAMVVALLALFVALGGTVYAASTINGKSVKKNTLPGNRVKTSSLPGNKLKKQTVAANRLKNETITGTQINEATLGKVPSAATADTATTALSASPPAYGHINANGSIDSANSHNIGSVTHPEEGVYCLSGIPVTPHVILAEVDSFDGPGVTEASVLTSNFIGCPPGTNAEIVTYEPDTIEFTDYAGGFYVVIF